MSRKAYRTYSGPNKFFGDIARILMEYAFFAHINPTSMPQKKAAIIITAYQGGVVDWGILTRDGVCVALSSFQSGKRFLPVLTHYLTVLYPSPTTPISPTPPPKMQRQRALNFTPFEWEDPAPTSPPSHIRASTKQPPTIATDYLTIRQRTPRISTYSPL